jgi:branched-chain amino acid transport system permease protein
MRYKANQILRKREPLYFGILLITILLIPNIVENQYYLIVLNIIGLNTIVVIGLNMLIGFAGQISLGHAAFYGMGAYFSGVLTTDYGFPIWAAMIIGMAATAVVAFLVGYPALKLRGHYLVMATLGFSIIIYILMVELDQITGGPDGLIGIPHLSFYGIVFDDDQKNFCLIWSFVFLCLLLSRNLLNSRVGRALRAIHGSEIAANSLGINTSRYKVKIFVLSAVYASLAGSLYAHYIAFVSPRSFDFYYSIEVVTMVIVGGMGSLWGSLFGAGLLTFFSEALHIAERYQVIAYGVFLSLVLIFLPEGVLIGLSNIYKKQKIKRRIDDEGIIGETNGGSL